MTLRLSALVVVLLAFGALTVRALAESGYVGVFAAQLSSWAGMQVLADLVILAVLACLWMLRDAPRHGLPAWPFLLITLAAGAFGPLLYLVARELRTRRTA
jgi:hypothetical protein